jgi:hypothetical protein
MTTKRYVLANAGEALPFRGRRFRSDGETMNPDDAYTRRLLDEGVIREVETPLPPDLGTMTKDELLAEAARRGVDVSGNDTKAEIIAAIEGDK